MLDPKRVVDQMETEFQAGAASRDAEVSDWRSQAHRSQSEADNAIAECAQLRAELAAEQAKNVELLEIAKKGLRHYENRNIAHGTRNPAAIALDEIAAIQPDTSALEAIVKKAGEVMRDRFRIAEAQGWLNKEFIRALPAVTLEDLK